MKRVPQLRDLSDDHHTALVLARRCKEALRPDSPLDVDGLWALVKSAYAHDLEPHFAIEERYLLPGLESIGEAALAERIRDDHTILRALLAEEAVDVDSLGRFGERLEAHVRFEEREVFEPTQHRLPTAVLGEIAAACEENARSRTGSDSSEIG